MRPLDVRELSLGGILLRRAGKRGQRGRPARLTRRLAYEQLERRQLLSADALAGSVATISGVKWNDLNWDGVKDSGEPGLENWKIYAETNGNGQWESGEPFATTGSNGSYTITVAAPATYTVREVLQSGWHQTAPDSTGVYTVTVAAGDEVTDRNFGNSSWFSLGGYVRQATFGTTHDGKLEAFGIGGDHAVWHRQLTDPTNPFKDTSWTAWESLGGYAQQIAVASKDDATGDRLELFVVGGDYTLWSIRENAQGGWTSGAWNTLGGYVQQIAAEKNRASGLVEVFAVGGDNQVWTLAQTATQPEMWGYWQLLGGYAKQVEVEHSGPGQTPEVFVLGGDNAVWHLSRSGDLWGNWISLGGYATQINVEYNHPTCDTLELTIAGGNNAAWHRYRTGSSSGTWSDWSSFSGYVTQVFNGSNLVDSKFALLAEGYQNTVWGKTGSGSQWGSWGGFGGYANQIAGGSTSYPGTTVAIVGVVGGDNQLWIGGMSSGAALMAAGPAMTSAQAMPSLDASSLQSTVDAAIAAWAGRGIPASSIDALKRARFVVTDLPAGYLGLAKDGSVSIDADAAGHGWFVDRTLAENEEFAPSAAGRDLRAIDPRAVDRIDLLTVVEHELGHVAGFQDLPAGTDSVMAAVLPSGTRRFP